jgi:hypothetical protein
MIKFTNSLITTVKHFITLNPGLFVLKYLFFFQKFLISCGDVQKTSYNHFKAHSILVAQLLT